MHLEREGFLELQPNRGFFVTSLSQEQAVELYPLLGLLEAHALHLTGLPEPPRAAQLAELNEALLAHEDAHPDTFSINSKWHTLLTSGCPNGFLLKMLASMRRKVYRYEWACSDSNVDRVRDQVENHDEILAHLESGDMPEATAALRRHWATDLDTLLPFLFVGEPAPLQV